MTALPALATADVETYEQRQSPRQQVAAMYSLLRAREAGQSTYNWTGHIYDISLSGMRFELDASVEPGTRLEVRCVLPGLHHAMFRAVGQVVRIVDEQNDSQGPTRMGMVFERFHNELDRSRLTHYLSHSNRRAA